MVEKFRDTLELRGGGEERERCFMTLLYLSSETLSNIAYL